MLSSSFLDVAIGIVFVFLMLSLIATTVNEIILSFFNMRGRVLLDGLKTLLNDPEAEGLVKEIYNHGQVYGLFKGEFNPGKTWKYAIPLFRTVTPGLGKCTRDNLPSYIPTTNFVMAFLGVMRSAPEKLQEAAAEQAKDADAKAKEAEADAVGCPNDKDKQAAATKAREAATKAQEKADRAKKAADEVQSALNALNTVAGAVATSSSGQTAQASGVTPVTPAGTTSGATAADLAMAFQRLKVVAEALSNNPDTAKVGRPLRTILVSAEGDFNKLKAGVEEWYNGAMDRVSGWYKYNTQKMLFWIGIVLAIALNANTIDIVQQLSRNPTLRESIVAAAQLAVAEKKSAPVTNAAGGTTAGGGANAAGGSTPDLGKQLKDVSDQIKEVENLGIPLGWPARQGESWWKRNGDELQRPGAWIGWLFTAIAVSLGAPFWFDMLNKIMIVRSTVKPGEKSQPAKDKEKQ